MLQYKVLQLESPDTEHLWTFGRLDSLNTPVSPISIPFITNQRKHGEAVSTW